MLNKLLNKLKLILLVAFLVGSSIFYVVLHNFHEEEINQLIKENVLITKAMQEYVAEYQKPAIEKLAKEGKIPKDFFDPVLLSATFIVNKVHDIFDTNHASEDIHTHEKLEYKFASDNPTNPVNKATAFESEVLKKFNNSDISSYKEHIVHNGIEALFFALPVPKNTNNCLKCHGNPKDAPKQMLRIYGDKNGFHEKIGDIRAINAIYSSFDYDNGMLYVYLLVEMLMVVTFLIIYFTVRYFLLKLNEKDKFIVRQSKFAAMGEMISMIAHQWRQPLTAIGITANNLLLDIELQSVDEKRFTESLEIVNKQIVYLSQTIDDFKNFFKSSNNPEISNIAQLVNEACIIIGSSIKSKGIDLKIDIDDKFTVLTQKNDVIQIILNLIKNSMDAYEENKIGNRVIEISAIDKPERIELFFKDYAGGIPDEIIEKIFDPYFSTKNDQNGTGLGLYMSKLIIEQHLSGYIDVLTKDSTTTFKIVLIRKDAENGN